MGSAPSVPVYEPEDPPEPPATPPQTNYDDYEPVDSQGLATVKEQKRRRKKSVTSLRLTPPSSYAGSGISINGG